VLKAHLILVFKKTIKEFQMYAIKADYRKVKFRDVNRIFPGKI
jgi:hypothetical protein